MTASAKLTGSSLALCAAVAACGGDSDSGGPGGPATGSGGSPAGGSGGATSSVGEGLTGTGMYDGVALEFGCDGSFKATDGNISQYIEVVKDAHLFVVQCRSKGGSHQVKLALLNPKVGDAKDYKTADAGVSLGPTMGALEGPNFTTVKVNRISVTAVDGTDRVAGTFEAEWDQGPGNDWVSGPAAKVQGSFNAPIRTKL
ncbi:MAG: hypothetical protein IT374_14320 [Polyangiaceae bacterium]|nr:hypothetical protein [Polyangiaceae bacterium]